MRMRSLSQRLIFWGGALAAVLFLPVLCTPQLPASPEDDGEFTIELSIGRRGVQEAEFWGEPLRLLVQFEDSVYYGDFHINKGAAQEIPPDISRDQKFRTIGIPVFWAKEIPSVEDSTDTIFVMSGVAKSNEVFVRVMNRAPMIDSLIVSDTALIVKNDIFGDRIYTFECDTIATVALRVFAGDRDYTDRHSLDIAWRARDSSRLKHDPIEDSKATYETPATNFRDTILVVVSDGKYDLKTHLVLSRTSGASAILFDSVSVDSTVYDSIPAMLVHEFVALDSIPLNVWVRGFGVQLAWKAGQGDIASRAAAKGFSAVYACTTSLCSDTLEGDTSVAVDTITVTARDRMGISVTRRVQLLQVPSNRRPIIDSVQIGSVRYDMAADSQTAFIGAGDTAALIVHFHDPDGDTAGFLFQWESASGVVIDSATRQRAWYAAAQSPESDTVTISLADPQGFMRDASVALQIVTPPEIAEFTFGDSVRKAGSAFTYSVTRDDALSVVARFDESTENASVAWQNAGGGSLRSSTDSSVVYVSLDSAYQDTLFAHVFDDHGVSSEYTVYLHVHNRRPVIDSLSVGDQMLTGGNVVHAFSATVRDTLAIAAFVSDPDGETPDIAWRVKNPDHQALMPNAFRNTASYTCKDSLYRDTILISATDSSGAASVKQLVIAVNNRYPVIDSLMAGSTVFRSNLSTSGYGYTAPAGTEIAFEVFAHDPDEGDQFSILWKVSGGDQQMKMRENAVRFVYIASDLAYSDTAIVTVTDEQDRTDTKLLYLSITKKP